MSFLKTVVFFAATILSSSAGSLPTSTTSNTDKLFNGQVELPNNVKLTGEQYWQSDNGDSRGFAYYGYKYGTAERFEHSVANTDFSYLDNPNRVKLGEVCWQTPMRIPGFEMFSRNLSMSEDCLFLDVYVPPVKRDQQDKTPWPVLFWVYGGGFKIGDKDLYNGSIFAKSVNAIIVTVNYRLSAFGFLSTGDEAARGNWAIGDLKLALNWTIANIASFNGDPSKITMFGESAGGALVSALMLDEDVRGKTIAAVAMSGSIVRPWAIGKEPKKLVKILATGLKCPTGTSEEMIKCLKTFTPDEILNATETFVEKLGGFVMHYTPVIDGQHILKEPAEIIRDRANQHTALKSPATFISGFMADDTSFFLLMTPHLMNLTGFNVTIVTQLLSGLLMAEKEVAACPKSIPGRIKLILERYNVSDAGLSGEEIRKKYFTLSTHMMFGLGTMEESILYANIPGEANKNQMYIVSYDPGFMNLGAFHVLEVIHIFRGSYLDNFMKDKISNSLTESMHNFFRQIAYNGRADGPLFGSVGNYLDLDQQAKWVEKKDDFASLVNFWKGLKDFPCPA